MYVDDNLKEFFKGFFFLKKRKKFVYKLKKNNICVYMVY